MTEETGITEVMALIAVITSIDVIIMTGETITIVGTTAEAMTGGTTTIDETIVEATIAEITMTAEVMIDVIVEMAMTVGMAVTIVGIIMTAEEVVIAMIADQTNVMVSQILF